MYLLTDSVTQVQFTLFLQTVTNVSFFIVYMNFMTIGSIHGNLSNFVKVFMNIKN